MNGAATTLVACVIVSLVGLKGCGGDDGPSVVNTVRDHASEVRMPKPRSPAPGTLERSRWTQKVSQERRNDDRVAWLRYLEQECERHGQAASAVVKFQIGPAISSGSCVEASECLGWELFEGAVQELLPLNELFGWLASTGSTSSGDPVDFAEAHRASYCWNPTERWNEEFDAYRKEALMTRAKLVWRTCDDLNKELYARKVALAEGVADGSCPSGGSCKAMADLRDHMFKMQKEVPEVMGDARQLLRDASSYGSEEIKVEIARGVEKFCEGTGRYPRRALPPSASLD